MKQQRGILDLTTLMPLSGAAVCQDREILKQRVREDLKAYADAVNSLQQSIGKGFSRARERAERARQAFEASSKRLSDHVASHGCG